MRYRIVKDVEGFYPQVNIGFRFLPCWMRIGVHNVGFGLYSDKDYPVITKEKATEVINNYHKWRSRNKKTNTVTEFELK